MTKKYKFRYQSEIYREYSGGYNPEVDWWVMASSEDAAFSKLLRRARQNYGPDADIDETLIKNYGEYIPKQSSSEAQSMNNTRDVFIKPGKCPECGTQLTDGGFCPICDLGEKDYD